MVTNDWFGDAVSRSRGFRRPKFKYVGFAGAGLILATLLSISFSSTSRADSRELIDDNAQRSLKWMYDSSRHTARQLKKAAGVLVFGDVVKMGFGLGGEFGEGALIVDGEIVQYYAIAGKKFGVPDSALYKTEAIVFRTEKALKKFRTSHSWKIGRDAVVPVVSSVERSDKVLKSSQPVIGYVFTDAGIVEGLGLDGNKITQIAR